MSTGSAERIGGVVTNCRRAADRAVITTAGRAARAACLLRLKPDLRRALHRDMISLRGSQNPLLGGSMSVTGRAEFRCRGLDPGHEPPAAGRGQSDAFPTFISARPNRITLRVTHSPTPPLGSPQDALATHLTMGGRVPGRYQHAGGQGNAAVQAVSGEREPFACSRPR